MLGSGDRKRWEDVIFSFIQSGQLKVIERPLEGGGVDYTML